MTTYDALTGAMRRTAGIRGERIRLGAAHLFGLIVALGLVLCGCSPVEGDAIPARAAGVSVQDHWATLEEIEDQLERTAAMAHFVTTLGPEDSEAIRELVNTGFRGRRSIDHLILMNVWSRVDVESAMARAMASSAAADVAARADGIQDWASRDPLAASAAANINTSEIRRALVKGWYESGEPGLTDFIFKAGSSQAGQHLIASYVTELAYDKGAQGVEEWIDSVRARKDLEQIIIVHVHRKGMVAMAFADPEAAIAYCDIHCEQPYADSARPRLADRLGWLELGDRAIAWVEASEGANIDDRRLAGRGAYRHWFKADRDAALVWAEEVREKYADEAWFEGIARFVLGMLTRMDPEAALAWVPLLPTDQEQEDAMVSIGRRWYELDEGEAEVWLESSPLDDEARAKARTPMKYHGRAKKRGPAS